MTSIARLYNEMIDQLASVQVDLLRRTARELSAGIDLAAQRDVEGAGEWRDLNRKDGRFE